MSLYWLSWSGIGIVAGMFLCVHIGLGSSLQAELGSRHLPSLSVPEKPTIKEQHLRTSLSLHSPIVFSTAVVNWFLMFRLQHLVVLYTNYAVSMCSRPLSRFHNSPVQSRDAGPLHLALPTQTSGPFPACLLHYHQLPAVTFIPTCVKTLD